MKTAFLAVPIIILVSCLSLVAMGAQSMRQALVKPSDSLTLLFSGSELGYLEPCGCSDGQFGGLPRRDSLIQQLASKTESLLRVANGNLVDGGGRQSELKAEIGFAALKEMGYVAVNVGAKDLSLGSVDISTKPDKSRDEVEKSEITSG